MEIDFKIEGVKEVVEELVKLSGQFPEATGAALLEEGESLRAQSVLLCPVDTGRLRATAYVSPPRINEPDGPEVQVGYGTNYAIPVHERTNVYHPTGQAKFLEQPASAAVKGFAQRLSDRIKKHINLGTWKS